MFFFFFFNILVLKERHLLRERERDGQVNRSDRQITWRQIYSSTVSSSTVHYFISLPYLAGYLFLSLAVINFHSCIKKEWDWSTLDQLYRWKGDVICPQFCICNFFFLKIKGGLNISFNFINKKKIFPFYESKCNFNIIFFIIIDHDIYMEKF